MISHASNQIIALAAILFFIGLFGLIIRRNALVALMCVELMLNAGLLAIFGAAIPKGDLSAQVVMILIMMIGAAEAAVGLSIIVAAFKYSADADLDNYSSMKW